MKTCLFCGSGYFDNENKCTLCHRSCDTGALIGTKVEGYRRRDLICPSYRLSLLLLLIPAAFLFFMGVLVFMSHSTDIFMFIFLPSMTNGQWFAFLCFLGSAIMLICAIRRYRTSRKAYDAYCEILTSDYLSATNANIRLTHYYRYEKMLMSKGFWLLLLPILFYPLFISYIYYADNYTSMLIFDRYFIILPNLNGCNAFKFVMYVFPVLSGMAHLLDFVICLVNGISCRRNIKNSLLLNQEMREGQTYASDSEGEDGQEGEGAKQYGASDIPFAFEDYTDAYGDEYAKDQLKNLKLIDEAMANTEEAPCADMSLEALCARLRQCLINHGVDVAEEQIIGLVSSMAAYRLISLDADAQCREDILAAVSECFGTEASCEAASEAWQEEKDMLFTSTEEEVVESGYLNGLYTAHYKPAHVCTVSISDADPSALCRMMERFSAYSKTPSISQALMITDAYNKNAPKKAEWKVKTGTYNRELYMQIPQNAWCFLTTAEHKRPYVSCRTLLEGSALTVSVQGSRKKISGPVASVDGLPISYQSFMTLVRKAGEQTYLSEDQWKKFDKLEAFLNERIGFAFDNRLCRKIETYTDVFLGCGGDVNHAIDCVLTHVLSSVLADHDIEKLRAIDGKMSLIELMDKTFGSDNIQGCHGLLKKFGLEY